MRSGSYLQTNQLKRGIPVGFIKSKKKSQLLGIDIGSHSIKFVVGKEVGTQIKLNAAFSQSLPKEVYENGNILDIEAMGDIIQSALRKNRVHVRDVVVTIESSEMIKREMIIPKVDPEDRDDLIAYEVNQYLPIDTSAYVLQHMDIEDVVEDNVEKTRILLGAIPKEIIHAHFELLKNCDLNPKFMDMHSNSIEKLLQFSVLKSIYLEKRTVALIDFGHKMIDIGVYENGDYKFNRLLRMGGNAITQFIVRQEELDYEVAEVQKEQTSVKSLARAYSELNEQNDPKSLVVMDTIEYLNECIGEISKVFKYYTSRGQDQNIEKVLLHGGSAKFEAIAPYIAERLDVKTELLMTLPNVEITAKIKIEELPLYANAIGALIRR